MLSVIFSTYNGERTLPIMLEALSRLQSPESGYEIVAVLNGCTDCSEDILKSFSSRLPMKIIHEPMRGKNFALNSALKIAQGDLFVFTDDDVIPDQDWLVNLEAVASLRSDYDIFGGIIQPHWLSIPPQWILESVPMGPVFAVHSDGVPSGPTRVGSIWGANMMVRTRVFHQGHSFSTYIGPDGTTNYSMGSESEFLGRLAEAGFKGWFCREARVLHIIRPNQIDPVWMAGRGYRYGRFRYHHGERALWGSVPRFKGVPRWMWQQYMRNVFRRTYHHWFGREREFFLAAWEVAYFRGLLYEAARDAAGAK